MGGAFVFHGAVARHDRSADGRGGCVTEFLGGGQGVRGQWEEISSDAIEAEVREVEGLAAEVVADGDCLIVDIELRVEVALVVPEGLEKARVWVREPAGDGCEIVERPPLVEAHPLGDEGNQSIRHPSGDEGMNGLSAFFVQGQDERIHLDGRDVRGARGLGAEDGEGGFDLAESLFCALAGDPASIEE
jgi:hypothetical protein